MTFQEAKEKLAQVSGGKYRALYYELITSDDGVEQAECRLYVHSGITHEAKPTWAEAFAALDAAMNPAIAVAPASEEAPLF
jgi:hypothetical protein